MNLDMNFLSGLSPLIMELCLLRSSNGGSRYEVIWMVLYELDGRFAVAFRGLGVVEDPLDVMLIVCDVFIFPVAELHDNECLADLTATQQDHRLPVGIVLPLEQLGIDLALHTSAITIRIHYYF